MSSSHRAKGRARGLGPWFVGVAVIVVVAVGAVLALVLDGSGDKTPARTTATPTTSPTAAPSPAPTATPTAPASPSSSAPPHKRPHKKAKPRIAAIAASPPHEITIGSVVANAGFGDALSASNGALFPAGPTDLQRLSTRGTPGSPGTDTVVLVGAANDHGTGVLDDLDQVRTGEKVVLTTQTGVLTYRITELLHAAPSAVLGLSQVSAKVPGRLVIDRADYVNHNRTGSDLVVVAQLVKAEKLPS